MDNLNGAPIVRAVIGGRPRTVLIDTGSSISLIQPVICSTEITRANVTPYGVTGKELHVKGEQLVIVTVNGETYIHAFCVCELATEADSIIGTDFLRKMDATLDFESGKLRLNRARNVYHYPLRGRRREFRVTAARAALTVLPTRRPWQEGILLARV
jgi:predicted aspartyl protease